MARAHALALLAAIVMAMAPACAGMRKVPRSRIGVLPVHQELQFDRTRAGSIERGALIRRLERHCAEGEEGAGASCFALGWAYMHGDRGLPYDMARAEARFEEACGYEDPRGCTNYGLMRREAEPARAQHLLEEGCLLGDSNGCLEAGRTHPDPRRALDLLRAACDGGEAAGCALLAIRLEKLPGARRDARRIADLHRRGCNLDDPESCRLAGDAVPDEAKLAVYERGCGRGDGPACNSAGAVLEPADPARALPLYRQACDANLAAGCANAARLYDRGPGVPRDAARALELHLRACAQGIRVSCRAAGMLEEDAGDTTAALGSYQQACRDPGGEAACADVGRLREPEDPAAAAELYRHACEAKDPHGCHDLARLLDEGRGVARDRAAARRLEQSACDGGVPAACFAVGLALARDDHDLPAAEPPLARACDLGVARACDLLQVLGGGGAAVDAWLYQTTCDDGDLRACYNLAAAIAAHDEARAQALYERACEGKIALACNNLGRLLEKRDARAAEGWYRRACDQGAPLGCGNLGVMLVRRRAYREGEELLGRACRADAEPDADACAKLADVVDGPQRVADLRRRACKLAARLCR